MGPAHAALGAGTAAANVEAMTCPRALLLLLLLFPVLACDPGAPNAPPSTDDAPEDSTEAAPSAATAGTGALWPGAIAYQDDCAAGEFDPYALCGPTVAAGVAEWNRRVGFLPLVRRTTEANYLTLRPSHTPGLGESYVGMQGGAQVVLVPDTGRLNTSVAGFLHEIGHAAGLAHEHARFDRDWFVELNRTNITDSRQFSMGYTGADVGWYDLRSIMHYRSEDLVTLAVDRSQWVMRLRNGSTTWTSVSTLSEGDVSGLRALYYGDWSGTRYDLAVSLAARRPGSGVRTYAEALAPKHTAYPFACFPGEECLNADLDNNGTDDVVVFNHGRGGYSSVYTLLSDGGGYALPQTAHGYFCTAGEVCAVGDVDGDGRADLVTFQHGTGGGTAVYVAKADASRPGRFGASFVAAGSFCPASATCLVADVDASGTADLVSIDLGAGTVSVVLTHGGTGLSLDPPFEAPASWLGLRVPTDATLGQLRLADVDGDRRADAVWFGRVDGRVHVALSGPGVSYGRFGSTLPGFGRWTVVHGWFCVGREACRVGDVDGDGKVDLVTFDQPNARTWVAKNSSRVGAPSFGGGELWSEQACAVAGGTCELADVNGDGADDVVEFTR
jgi:hypothetical protein